MSNLFRDWKTLGKKALVAYVTAGYPTPKDCLKSIQVLGENGADLIEIGVPFSDPIADGPVIQGSSAVALENRIGISESLEFARNCSLPVLFISYLNPVLSYGMAKFFTDAHKSNAVGVIFVDLIPEHASIVGKSSMPIVFLCSPTCSYSRIESIDGLSNAFIYLVSVRGITGARKELSGDLETFVSRVRKISDKPLYVGFGISSAEQAGRVAKIADGVIIGSKIIELIGRKSVKKLANFVKSVKASL